MLYDLFVCDFDGTLGIAPDIIEKETVKAVNDYINAGGKFVICTGRMYGAIAPICRKYGIKGPVISYQGAKISDIESDEILFAGGIEPLTAAKATEDLLRENVFAVADIEDVMYCEKDSEYTEFHRKFCKVVKVKDLPSFVAGFNKKVYKVAGTDDPVKIFKLTEKYSEIYKGSLVCNNGGVRLLEVISPDCTKGKAVRFLADYYGVPLNKVIAMGDSTNDIELVSGEWKGIAVGDGREELKAVAKEITVPFREQPVRFIIDKYRLR